MLAALDLQLLWLWLRRQSVQVPIMLRSDYCNLSNQSERALCDLGECPYDQVSLRAGVSNTVINRPAVLLLEACT